MLGTSTPVLFAGQATTLQEELKNGHALVAFTLPANPALHRQPLGTLTPVLSAGQETAEQLDT